MKTMKINTIEEREKRANTLRTELIEKFCKYHSIEADSDMAGTLFFLLTMMRNELL